MCLCMVQLRKTFKILNSHRPALNTWTAVKFKFGNVGETIVSSPRNVVNSYSRVIKVPT